jgi:pantetheine-phosphate adenylyltransferase
MKRIAIYPGSFNPLHDGHINVVNKAIKLFDEVYVVASINVDKKNDVDVDEHVLKIKNQLPNDENIHVVANKEMFTVEFAESVGAQFIIRGLRSTDDFEKEIELYDANKMLNHNIETVYLLTDIDKREVSSSMMRSIETYRALLEEAKKK